MIAVVFGEVLTFDGPGVASSRVPVLRGARGMTVGHDEAAAILDDGWIVHFVDGVWEPLWHAQVAERARLVSVSSDGRRVLFTTSETDLSLAHEHGIVDVPTPDFIDEVVEVRHLPDHDSFAFAWATSQPYSDYGSYGEPQEGVHVLDAEREVRMALSGPRPRRNKTEWRLLHWTTDYGVLVTCERLGEDACTLVTTFDPATREQHDMNELGRAFECARIAPERDAAGDAVLLLDAQGVVWLDGEREVATHVAALVRDRRLGLGWVTRDGVFATLATSG